MFGIIIGTHEDFAPGLLKACEMICGEQENVRAVSLAPGEDSGEVAEKYKAAMKELDCKDGVLFLNDFFGGSPYNAACRIVIDQSDCGIVTGVNLPMLIEMVSAQAAYDGSSIKELMERAVEAGKKGLQTFNASGFHMEDDDEV